jgi:multifunctional 2-oxoglutarate metabolism enzyme
VFTEVREAADSQPTEWTTVPDYPEKPVGTAQTSVTPEVMKRIADAYVTPPEGFTVHPKVMPQLQRRANAIADGPIDWGTGEILAFGSLLMDDRPVRLAGQDSRRGTFVQRFATIIDRTNAHEWTPLTALTEDQAKVHIYDSLLSEYAALAFEYGYSVARPDALVLWEAQFGDFVNGAQTVIDEFITSGETKWRQQSGVVLLLPHGYEGQGPDHSSARIERWLTMAADDAFVVAQPSTPASYFHLLRQHSLGEEHRPMAVFTPKSMLKRKEAASQPSDFTEGTFRPFLADEAADPALVDTLLICSGRITWDLMLERSKREDAGRFAIARIEQLYPTPLDEIRAELARYPGLTTVRWVQDEPGNMGPRPYYELNVWPRLGMAVEAIARPPSSSPSVGTAKRHTEEQKSLMAGAFASAGDRTVQDY